MELSIPDLLRVLLAWEAGEVTEGQVLEATGLPRVEVRRLKEDGVAAGVRIAASTRGEATGLTILRAAE